jgi:tRNA (guanine37-N1)-methyltransferase
MLEIHIISLFPNSIHPYLDTSIMKRAQEKGLFQYFIHNLADWSVKNTRRVDDRPYGGGAGTLITIEPLTNCIRQIQQEHGSMSILYVSPRGRTLSQEYCHSLIENSGKYIIICGHYE